jgi:hypothetical protein
VFETVEHGRKKIRLTIVAIFLAAVTLANLACRSANKPEAKPAAVAWRPVGTWSGHGNAQTDSFDIGYGQCRVRWEARNENPPGAGKLTVTVNSAVSGRELGLVVDHRGVGHDIAYVAVDPHWSYLIIESSNLDWSVTVEEPVGSPAGVH